MRHFLKSSGRRLGAGWFWALVMLALPQCSLDSEGSDPLPSFFPGSNATSAIMCDIKVVPGEGADPCASPQNVADGISLTDAATALAEGRKSTLGIALDFRQSVVEGCGGFPGKTLFYGEFPDGLAVCLNCASQMPVPYADPTEVCVAKCKDLINFGGGPFPDEGVPAFCAANARVSTNFDKTQCFPNACSPGGTPLPNFADPRRTQEDVTWIEEIGTGDFGGSTSLTRTAATTGPDTIDFNAGAASAQLITTGDAWVEFGIPPGATETTLSHVLGVRESCIDFAACPDNPSLDDIGFAISLNSDGQVYVIESGTPLAVFGPFGDPYTAAERFRVKIKDNHDNTATISYVRLTGPCTPGTACVEDEFHTSNGPAPQYPLRINASFREVDATIANVTMVRIIEQ